MRQSLRSALGTVLTFAVVYMIGCQGGEAKGGVGVPGAATEFPERIYTQVNGNVKQGGNAFNHELARKVPTGRSAIAEAGVEFKPQKKLSDDEKAKVDQAVKAAGFESVEQFYEVYNELWGARNAVMRMRKAQQSGLSDFQKTALEEAIEDYTEADLRFAADME